MGAAVAIPLITALIGTGTAVYSSEEQKRQAGLATDAQRNMQQKQEEDLQNKTKQDQAQAQADQWRATRKAMGSYAGGRQSTILTTSPLATTPTPTAPVQKTVLGA